jgi:hypothetical protein
MNAGFLNCFYGITFIFYVSREEESFSGFHYNDLGLHCNNPLSRVFVDVSLANIRRIPVYFEKPHTLVYTDILPLYRFGISHILEHILMDYILPANISLHYYFRKTQHSSGFLAISFFWETEMIYGY